jgi:Domain of unknown function (DUF4337)
VDDTEVAQDHLTEAAEEHGASVLRKSRLKLAAVVAVAILGAAAGTCEMSAEDAQTKYTASNIEASDTWAQYQAKSVRRVVLESQAVVLSHLPNASDPAIVSDVAKMKSEAQRMISDPEGGGGMQQISKKAKELQERREYYERLHERLEKGARAIGIGIVITGLSLALESVILLGSALVIGMGGILYALAVGLGWL